MSGADPQYRLPIRSRYRAPAFRVIEEILREDPALSQHIRTWRSREGFDGDLEPPGVDAMPLVHLTPMPEDSKTESEISIKAHLKVGVEVYAPGTCVDDILAIWEAIEDAIVGSKPHRGGFVEDRLCQAGIIALRSRTPGFSGASLQDRTPRRAYQWAVGSLSCTIRRPA